MSSAAGADHDVCLQYVMEAVSDALGIIFTESYISLAALLAMFLMAFGFASAGGVGASSAPAGSTVAKFAKDQDSVRSRLALRCGSTWNHCHVRHQKDLPYSGRHPLLPCVSPVMRHAVTWKCAQQPAFKLFSGARIAMSAMSTSSRDLLRDSSCWTA